MSSWVEHDALIHALLVRDAVEVWRNLKVSLRQAVEDYIRIYVPAGTVEVQFTDCSPVNENCVRIRTISPPATKTLALEVYFSPEGNIIEGLGSNDKQSFHLVVEDKKVVLRTHDDHTVSVEDVSRAFLKPLFDKLPRRKPNINLNV